MVKIAVLSASMFVLFAVSGCSQLNEELGVDIGDETAQGAAVGGAMGAGLGAIIGSQTGSAGAGLVIGGLAGAGAGAAIGSSLQERSESLRAQDELIERQQQRLAANSRALEQLNAGRDPTTSERLRNIRAAELRATESRAAGLRAAESSERVGSNSGSLSSARAPFTSPARIDSEPHGSAVKTVPANESAQGMRAGLKDIASSSRLSRESGTDAGRVKESSAAQGGDPLIEREILEVKPNQAESFAAEDSIGSSSTEKTVSTMTGSSTGAIVTGLQNRGETDDDCVIADSEISLASKASAAADKLFHQRKALRLCPNTAKYHLAIADTYHALNRKSDAEFEIREALRLDPQNEAAQAKLKELK